MKILAVVGTRPNFIKMAPVVAALRRRAESGAPVETRLVHTGQHYDFGMSEVFFRDLGLPEPDVNLGLGALTPWAQTGRIIDLLGDQIAAARPDWTLAPGDVNSTLAAAVAATRAGSRLAHLEAGLRSFDRDMPEELNRVAVDHLADLLFVTEPAGLANLTREGVPDARVRHVGNTMIDTLFKCRDLARDRPPPPNLGLAPGARFTLVTMHRPATVDRADGLRRLLAILAHAARRGPVVFPVHPRTRARLHEFGLAGEYGRVGGLALCEPAGYLDFLSLMVRARVVLTDSGGIQEETTALGVPCLTLRDNTERPITVERGTSTLVGNDPDRIRAA
ncbi:MAG: UDP-N-acetylglucosamine 2-epimerase (non-hydrolyzing), partial [Planctomycetes bacterium]|nr:UDP-N-acetylglucosamine 2-epimerase (non-hydrolyzing) [Planctomycetota bacterium]